MLRLIVNKKGIGLIEVIIAMFLTSVGIMALLSLQAPALQTTARSDYIGRASGILYKTLENYETRILNPCNIVTTGAQAEALIKVSGGSAAIAGDLTYTVNANIDQDVANPKAFIVTVTVTWPNNTNGISESLYVARQEHCRFPLTPVKCSDSSL